MAKIIEKTIIGTPALWSSLLFFILCPVAPMRLTVLKNSPTGFAVITGTPRVIKIGINTIAAPTPPRAKIKAETSDIMKMRINVMLIL